MTFEEWAESRGHDLQKNKYGYYLSRKTRDVFDAWQASREAAIEMCIDALKSRDMGDNNREDLEVRR